MYLTDLKNNKKKGQLVKDFLVLKGVLNKIMIGLPFLSCSLQRPTSTAVFVFAPLSTPTGERERERERERELILKVIYAFSL